MSDPVRPDPATRDHIAHHTYVSTYCLHAVHGDCRLTCKVCSAACLCTCHTTQPSLPDVDDYHAMNQLGLRVQQLAAANPNEIRDDVAWTVRALAERGKQ